MKYVLITVFILGLFFGLYLTMEPAQTGAAVTCVVEDTPCICAEDECQCGNITISSEYCQKDFKQT